MRSSSRCALDTATPAGRSLKEKVAFTESFLICKDFNSKSVLRFVDFCKGVKPELMLTMLFLSFIGKSSIYLQ